MLWPALTSRRWTPWTELDQLEREMSRLFTPYSRDGVVGEYPAVNIWTRDDGALLTAEVPGIKPEDLDIAVNGDTVTIRGKREQTVLDEGETWLRRERGAGDFVRSYSLPFSVEADKVTATYRNGILELALPRADADMPRKITVKAK